MISNIFTMLLVLMIMLSIWVMISGVYYWLDDETNLNFKHWLVERIELDLISYREDRKNDWKETKEMKQLMKMLYHAVVFFSLLVLPITIFGVLGLFIGLFCSMLYARRFS